MLPVGMAASPLYSPQAGTPTNNNSSFNSQGLPQSENIELSNQEPTGNPAETILGQFRDTVMQPLDDFLTNYPVSEETKKSAMTALAKAISEIISGLGNSAIPQQNAEQVQQGGESPY